MSISPETRRRLDVSDWLSRGLNVTASLQLAELFYDLREVSST